MLVVVHHGDVERAFQPLFNIETFGRLDVFKVYSSECRGYAFYGFAEFLRILFGYFNVEHVYATVNLEEQPFAFHDRLAAYCADVAEPENGRTVAYDGYEIALVGVFVGVVRRFLYFKARECHSRRICQAEVCLRAVRFGGFYLDFSGFAATMVFKCGLFRDIDHKFYVLNGLKKLDFLHQTFNF